MEGELDNEDWEDNEMPKHQAKFVSKLCGLGNVSLLLHFFFLEGRKIEVLSVENLGLG